MKKMLWYSIAGIVFSFAASSLPAVEEAAEPVALKEIPPITEIRAYPESLVLDDLHDARHIVVSGKTAAGEWVDLTRHVTQTPQGAIVSVDEDGYIQPREVGETKVTLAYGGKSLDLPVTVISANSPEMSFVNDIMPVMTKVGCNAGACHGAQAGKNGFKLSLRGYDAEYDYQALVHDISGRRFNRVEPSQSLMLLKPTQGVPHKGGLVFTEDSRAYQKIHQWIAEGVKSDIGKVEKVEKLEIYPKAIELDTEGMTQQFIVMGVYADGKKRDITREVDFTSSVPEVATVDRAGMVTSVRRGETAILMRYEGIFETSGVVVMGDRSGFEWQETEEYNYVDTLVYNKLKKLKILPSETCTDEEFLRRVYLDLTGIPPQPDAVRAFLKDNRDQRAKRNDVIDQLIGSKDFVEHWTHKLADLLQSNRLYLGEKGVWLFRMWIRDAVENNMPYDKFVRALLTSSGSTYQNPAANFYRVNRDPSQAAENVTQVFLGVRFNCNKCHDHPFEKWTQKQYYQLGAFFGDVGLKNGTLPDEEVVYTKFSDTSVIYPRSGEAIAPKVPFGETDDAESQRRRLAEWMTSKDNEFFARSTANRFWSYFMGRGIIDPVDDIRNSNPPSNPELLDKLTQEFVASGFDLRELMRTVCQSRTYQQSIATNQWNEDDTINFSHATARRLTAEQMLDSISLATGTNPDFEGLPEGFRACQLPDSRVEDGGFLKLFGRPDRESACECERTSQVSLSHALNLINGPTVSNAISANDGRISKLTAQNASDREIVEEIYLAAVSKLPTESEANAAVAYLSEAKTKEEGAQDLMWALINSPAFLFNR